MADLSVNIGELQMKNPVMTASGTFGYGEEFSDFIDITRIGGIIVKGTTLHKREGNPYPRMAETPSGMLNAVGLLSVVPFTAHHFYLSSSAFVFKPISSCAPSHSALEER